MQFFKLVALISVVGFCAATASVAVTAAPLADKIAYEVQEISAHHIVSPSAP